MKRTLKQLLSLALAGVTAFTLVGCGGSGKEAANALKEGADKAGSTEIASDSPYAGKGYDLSKRENIVLYVLGDEPKDMQKIADQANADYFEPNLNTTVDIKFLNWSDYTTKYLLLLSGGEPVDLIYTAAWCYYNEEAAKGAFVELTDEFLKQNMPYTQEQQPKESWNQISIDGKIYAVPKAKAAFTAYNITAVRQDLIDKYKLTVPDSFDNYQKYLEELAGLKGETGVVPLNTNANREQLLTTFLQTKGIQNVAEGYDWMYYNNGKEDAPDPADIFYFYGSDLNLEYCKKMSEFASKGFWSADAINDTTDSQAYFENGTSGSFIWNTSVFQAGKNLESANIGTYAVYDLTPDALRCSASYATDAIAITSKSKDQQRAALALDYMKSDVNLNRLLLGGVEGTHYQLSEEGTRIKLDGWKNYSWNNWAWALNREDEPDEKGLDEREIAITKILEDHEYHPEVAGFTFDPKNVETEYTVVKSIIDEYKQSFALGIYGDNTEKEFANFQKKLSGAGVDKVTDELKKQYEAYLFRTGLK
jgi:putative aldouronate transport system substrate-binding protein